MMGPQKASADSTGFTSQVAGMNLDSVMEKAVEDRMAEYMDQEKQKEWDAKAEMGLSDLHEQGDAEQEEKNKQEEERDGAGAEEEDELENLRARRRKMMKDSQEKRVKHQGLGHGQYDEITEEQFLKTVTSSNLSIVHFYHRHFEKCKIIDMHLSKCARKFFGTRVVKLDAEKTHFFVDKLGVKTLPCVIVFVDGVALGRQVGFEGLGGDNFTTVQLAWKLKQFGGIEEDVDLDEEII